jgi:hypothetical protein
MKVNDYIELKKLSNDVYGNFHPNGVKKGHILKGYIKNLPEVGKQFYMYDKHLYQPKMWTSRIDNIDEKEGIIKTKNSTYKIING